MVLTIIKSLFILLGFVSIIIGKLFPERKLIPSETKYRVVDRINYVKACRLVLYSIGVYYILLGIVLLIFKEWTTINGMLGAMVPALIAAILSNNWRKYLEKV